MLLACDIGNTNIKICIFREDELTGFNIFSSTDDLLASLKSVNISKAAISSVVPGKTKIVSDFLKNEFNVPAYQITKESLFNLKINYDTPETLGIDRICSAEGAFSIFKSSNEFINYNSKTFLLSVDLGTATTINIVGYPGEFLGGIIAPGIKIMALSLNKNTAQLPEVDFGNYKGNIGRDTKSSIASGIINSTIGVIERTIDFLKRERNAEEIKIYVTGGNAEVMIRFFDFEFIYEKGLVLKGIKSIYNMNMF